MMHTIRLMAKPEYPSGYDNEGRSLYYRTENVRPVYGGGIIFFAKSRPLRFGEISDIEITNITISGEPIQALKEYIRMPFGKNSIPTYIFDDHNHAFYAWNEALLEGSIAQGSTLYHLDGHPDTTVPILMPTPHLTLQEIAEYTTELPINSFIIPAMHSGLIKEVYQYNLGDLEDILMDIRGNPQYTILDIDIDVFEDAGQPIEPTSKQLLSLKEAMNRAGVITIATSPDFIDQNFALDVLIKLLSRK